MLEVGEKAPDFKLPGTSGTDVVLDEVVGSHPATVVAFYALDFTGG